MTNPAIKLCQAQIRKRQSQQFIVSALALSVAWVIIVLVIF